MAMLKSGFSFPSAEPVTSLTACSIVIVCFNSSLHLGKCIDLIRKDISASVPEIVVVNNYTLDSNEITEICALRNVILVQNRTNVGYGKACNIGAYRASNPYVLFLNPDVSISALSIQLMVQLASKNSDVVALGPLQCGSRGRVRGKRKAVGQRRSLGSSTLRALSEAHLLTPTGFLSGGALMVRKSTFERIGGFDERIFLFHEDDDICLRLAEHGRLAYASGVLVLHDWGQSSPPSASITKSRAWNIGYSKAYVLNKHYGRRAAYEALGEALLKFLSPSIVTMRGRAKAQAFLSGVVAALRDQSSVQIVMPE